MSIFNAAQAAPLVGVWDFQWATGNMAVEFRPDGIFYCEQYQAHSHWNLENGVVSIDWGKYGKYELTVASDGRSMDGSAQGNPGNWRKAAMVRSLTPAELCIMQTQWNFQHPQGSFEVEFHADGHFNCPQFPAHSHWKMTDGVNLEIVWGKYGTYDLVVDGATKTFVGSARGAPDQWRKGTWTKSMEPHNHSACGGDACGAAPAETDCCASEKKEGGG